MAFILGSIRVFLTREMSQMLALYSFYTFIDEPDVPLSGVIWQQNVLGFGQVAALALLALPFISLLGTYHVFVTLTSAIYIFSSFYGLVTSTQRHTSVSLNKGLLQVRKFNQRERSLFKHIHLFRCFRSSHSTSGRNIQQAMVPKATFCYGTWSLS